MSQDPDPNRLEILHDKQEFPALISYALFAAIGNIGTGKTT